MKGYRRRGARQVCTDPNCLGLAGVPPCARPVIDDVTPWEEDLICQVLVVLWGPMSLEEISAMLGVTRERVRQIEAAALEKLQASCAAQGIDLRVVLEQNPSAPSMSAELADM